MPEKKLRVLQIEGYSGYVKIWDLQKDIHERVVNGEDDTLILTEHKPVVTIGRSGGDDHFVTDAESLIKSGFDVVHTNRGGDITYHGPGQLVCYPIFNLNRHYRDVHRFLRDLEEIVIRYLRSFNIISTRIPGRTGVWTDQGKIAAIGIHVKKWTTMHGMSFNIKPDLSGFSHIVPCGISDAGVTALEWLIDQEIDMEDVKEATIRLFMEVFGFQELKA